MKILIQFFQESNGKMSMTRLTTFLLVLGGLLYGWINSDNSMFGIECILLGLGLKAHQRFTDNNTVK